MKIQQMPNVNHTDAQVCKSIGVDGVVIGSLKPDGTVDQEKTASLVHAAKPMAVTFHRAFDMTRDPIEALETIISIGGIQRILTSGQEATAIEGLDLIETLMRHAADRITIIPGGGVHERNIGKFFSRLKPHITEIHVAASEIISSPMQFKNPNVFMGSGLFTPEYSQNLTSERRVRSFLDNAKK